MQNRRKDSSLSGNKMTNRSANESIKGYSYQFDRSVVEILECDDLDAKFVVEGVEDIDIRQHDLSTFVQCKYYEGTEYNHSKIKPAIIAMIRHFGVLTSTERTIVKYRLYGHFKSGQAKLESVLTLDFMKETLLSYKKAGVTHHVHDELGLNDAELEQFKRSLEIDQNAREYKEQRDYLTDQLLIQQVPSCTTVDDAHLFFYTSAATAIQSLAIQPDIRKRNISKSEFIQQISKKDVVFNLWLQASFDSEKYAKVIKRNHFLINGTKRAKAARLFAIEVPSTFDLTKLSEALTKIATLFSNKEYVRTTEDDRFCPYVALRGISAADLIIVKERLHSEGLLFDDGYPFQGAKFIPKQLARDPTKCDLYKLKLLSSETEIKDVFNHIDGVTRKIYDFYIASRIPKEFLPIDISYDPINIESPYFITKIFLGLGHTK